MVLSPGDEKDDCCALLFSGTAVEAVTELCQRVNDRYICISTTMMMLEVEVIGF